MGCFKDTSFVAKNFTKESPLIVKKKTSKKATHIVVISEVGYEERIKISGEDKIPTEIVHYASTNHKRQLSFPSKPYDVANYPTAKSYSGSLWK